VGGTSGKRPSFCRRAPMGQAGQWHVGTHEAPWRVPMVDVHDRRGGPEWFGMGGKPQKASWSASPLSGGGCPSGGRRGVAAAMANRWRGSRHTAGTV
jgi:hypothetical protein